MGRDLNATARSYFILIKLHITRISLEKQEIPPTLAASLLTQNKLGTTTALAVLIKNM